MVLSADASSLPNLPFVQAASAVAMAGLTISQVVALVAAKARVAAQRQKVAQLRQALESKREELEALRRRHEEVAARRRRRFAVPPAAAPPSLERLVMVKPRRRDRPPVWLMRRRGGAGYAIETARGTVVSCSRYLEREARCKKKWRQELVVEGTGEGVGDWLGRAAGAM